MSTAPRRDVRGYWAAFRNHSRISTLGFLSGGGGRGAQLQPAAAIWLLFHPPDWCSRGCGVARRRRIGSRESCSTPQRLGALLVSGSMQTMRESAMRRAHFVIRHNSIYTVAKFQIPLLCSGFCLGCSRAQCAQRVACDSLRSFLIRLAPMALQSIVIPTPILLMKLVVFFAILVSANLLFPA